MRTLICISHSTLGTQPPGRCVADQRRAVQLAEGQRFPLGRSSARDRSIRLRFDWSATYKRSAPTVADACPQVSL
jgi:hypothetical protein